MGSLQQELDTSETVQKDFVKLSQSLQVELEKIRGADTEVRWQHIEDVIDCFGCKISFTIAKKKVRSLFKMQSVIVSQHSAINFIFFPPVSLPSLR